MTPPKRKRTRIVGKLAITNEDLESDQRQVVLIVGRSIFEKGRYLTAILERDGSQEDGLGHDGNSDQPWPEWVTSAERAWYVDKENFLVPTIGEALRWGGKVIRGKRREFYIPSG